MPVSDLFDAGDLVHFPLSFTAINMLMNASTAGVHYTITVPRFETVYDAIPAGVEGVETDAVLPGVYPNPVAAGDVVTIPAIGETARIFNASGAWVKDAKLVPMGEVAQMSTVGLVPGIYLVVVDSRAFRLVIK